ncbi:MAG: radical SAM protein [Candidatus Margulisiibacteriota bacterium]|jgi:spore photoproduct lyase
MTFSYQGIYIEPSQKDTPVAKQLRSIFPEKILTEFPQIDTYLDGKKFLAVLPPKGEFLRRCASFSEDYCCCGIHVLSTVSQCPFSCTYCFLQNYLNNPITYVIGDLDQVIREVKTKAALEPEKFFRIGTWELGDSLVLEPLTNQASFLINGLKDVKNVFLDFRTKSDQVDALLLIDHKQKVVLSWTLNPEAVIKKEEIGTASLEARIKAMQKAADHNYWLSLHFDPMIIHDNWEQNYQDLIQQVFDHINLKKVLWISIGSLRFNPEMKAIIRENQPKTKIIFEEMVAGQDHKMRYAKPLRIKLYQNLYQAIVGHPKWQALKESERPLLYLCMERPDMWDKIFGYHPKEDFDLVFKNFCTQNFLNT